MCFPGGELGDKIKLKFIYFVQKNLFPIAHIFFVTLWLKKKNLDN